MKKLAFPFTFLLLVLLLSCSESPKSQDSDKEKSEGVMIRLVDTLDEPGFYCIDIPGFGESIQLDAPLQMHTLKSFGAVDVTFLMDYPESGQIYNLTYDLCFEAEQAASGVSIVLRKASDSPLQRFELTSEGYIILKDHPNLGFVAGPEEGVQIGDTKFKGRPFYLQELDSVDERSKKWLVIESEETWPE